MRVAIDFFQSGLGIEISGRKWFRSGWQGFDPSGQPSKRDPDVEQAGDLCETENRVRLELLKIGQRALADLHPDRALRLGGFDGLADARVLGQCRPIPRFGSVASGCAINLQERRLPFFAPSQALQALLFLAMDEGGIVDARREFYQATVKADCTRERSERLSQIRAATRSSRQRAVKRAGCGFNFGQRS